jgi:hypothetical protein
VRFTRFRASARFGGIGLKKAAHWAASIVSAIGEKFSGRALSLIGAVHGLTATATATATEIRIARFAGVDELQVDLRQRFGGASALRRTRHERPDAIDDDADAHVGAIGNEAGLETSLSDQCARLSCPGFARRRWAGGRAIGARLNGRRLRRRRRSRRGSLRGSRRR